MSLNGKEKAHPDHISKEQLPAIIKDFIEVSYCCLPINYSIRVNLGKI